MNLSNLDLLHHNHLMNNILNQMDLKIVELKYTTHVSNQSQLTQQIHRLLLLCQGCKQAPHFLLEVTDDEDDMKHVDTNLVETKLANFPPLLFLYKLKTFFNQMFFTCLVVTFKH